MTDGSLTTNPNQYEGHTPETLDPPLPQPLSVQTPQMEWG